jgi:hypothetical protein
MAVALTEHACIVIDRFLDSVLSRHKAGQITSAAAQNEIAIAVTKIMDGQPDAIQYMELRVEESESLS